MRPARVCKTGEQNGAVNLTAFRVRIARGFTAPIKTSWRVLAAERRRLAGDQAAAVAASAADAAAAVSAAAEREDRERSMRLSRRWNKTNLKIMKTRHKLLGASNFKGFEILIT